MSDRKRRMKVIDRWYVAWRVLRGHAVEVIHHMDDDGQTMTVKFVDRRG